MTFSFFITLSELDIFDVSFWFYILRLNKLSIDSITVDTARYLVPALGLSGFRILCQGQGKADVNGAIRQVGMNLSPMGFHEFFDDGQADAGAAMVAGPGFLPAVKAFEKIGQILGENVAGDVGKIYFNRPGIVLDSDVYNRSLWCILNGIVGEVSQDAGQTVPVGLNGWRRCKGMQAYGQRLVG